MTRYYINGWEESRSYFKSVGRFTEEEKEKLKKGETVEKHGDTFRIEYDESDI